MSTDPRYPLGAPVNRPKPVPPPEPIWRSLKDHAGYETDGRNVRPKPA